MSAYGAIAGLGSRPALASTIWPTKPSKTSTSRPSYLTLHHLNLSRASELPGLIDRLHSAFAHILEDGMTYPQEVLEGEPYTRAAFDAYFFAGDVIVAIAGQGDWNGEFSRIGQIQQVGFDVKQAANGRSWEECVVGFYYVKPNYPGRSSHICNGGFVVPENQRGHGYGTVLAHSFLHYAPALGYQASVFNLVYVNNTASVRLWEALDFQKAGRIPRAGRLRRQDGNGEEYVDAWVFYKSFVQPETTEVNA